jgi:hypothetical protein
VIAKAETLIAAAGRNSAETGAVVRAALGVVDGGTIAELTNQLSQSNIQ